ncbi:MAG TPA: amidohydrolase, partial [Gammaproteobacteria bacterium]|nr:amidohydrolase [Gammaproteobacteria bacterium]
HHHLWPAPSRTEGVAPENRYLLKDLWKDTDSGHNLVKTVFIECGQGFFETGLKAMKPVGETKFVCEVAEQAKLSPSKAQIEGIVSHADMMLGSSVGEVLEAHIEYGKGRFKGIRHGASWDESEEIRNSHSNPIRHIYLDDQFQQGIEQLDLLNLTLDAWNYHSQINELKELAKVFPNLKIVQNHFGGPLGIGPYKDKKEEVFSVWSEAINELAECKNVYLKIGGLAMPINGWGWHKRSKPATSDELVESHGKYYLHAIKSFGSTRCMFESNFPVDKRSISYPVLWNAFKKISLEFSDEEKDYLFSKTAEEFYSI